MRSLDERRKRIALWTATGGTMAVIVALWAMILPMQLAENAERAANGERRWGVASPDGGAASEKKSLSEIIEEQRVQLQRVERETAAAPAADATPGDLLLRIEAATVAKSVTRPQ